MTIKFVDLEAQYHTYKDEINQQVLDVLESIQYIGGPQLDALEKELQDFCGCKYAIGCSNGTDSLLLALMAAGIKPQDEVITTSFTFVSTVEMICLLGATPVFVDIDPHTCLLDAKLIKQAITPKTKAIIPVSLFGQVAAMGEINSLAQEHSLVVIEDAAQSFGAMQKDKYSCDLSTYACTSFYPAKGLGCYGDGGAIFTDNQADADKIRSLLNHGQSERYEYVNIGINGRLDDIQAAILRVKLRHYKDEIQRRCQLAAKYDAALAEHPTLAPVKLAAGNKSVYSQYSLYVTGEQSSSKRDDYRKLLQEQGVPTGVYYPKPLHQHEVFTQFAPSKESQLKHTEQMAQSIFSLPVHPFLTDEQQDKIIAELQRLA